MLHWGLATSTLRKSLRDTEHGPCAPPGVRQRSAPYQTSFLRRHILSHILRRFASKWANHSQSLRCGGLGHAGTAASGRDADLSVVSYASHPPIFIYIKCYGPNFGSAPVLVAIFGGGSIQCPSSEITTGRVSPACGSQLRETPLTRARCDHRVIPEPAVTTGPRVSHKAGRVAGGPASAPRCRRIA